MIPSRFNILREGGREEESRVGLGGLSLCLHDKSADGGTMGRDPCGSRKPAKISKERLHANHDFERNHSAWEATCEVTGKNSNVWGVRERRRRKLVWTAADPNRRCV